MPGNYGKDVAEWRVAAKQIDGLLPYWPVPGDAWLSIICCLEHWGPQSGANIPHGSRFSDIDPCH